MNENIDTTSIVEDLQCTDKCLQALANNSQLQVRERQYCIVLSQQDMLSQNLSQHLSSSVDVQKMLNAGFLYIDSENHD